MTDNDITQLVDFLSTHRQILVISGAGMSTASGIPDYRDKDGEWKRKKPIYHQEFIDSHRVRQRYWARSLLGWRYFGKAQPNAGHFALAQLEQDGPVSTIITQNVDGLHQRAGSRNVIDLHGRVGELKCLSCGLRLTREVFQAPLAERNPHYHQLAADIAPDGDADLNLENFDDFDVPDCRECGGVIMPDVVFFGGAIPKARAARAMQALDQAQALLVVGSSLMVYSGYRFCREAKKQNKPIAVVNNGITRADDLIDFKVQGSCEQVLSMAAKQLC